ncbi:Imm1 family immunity protein [Saccharothrix sp. NRRL B-16314]|uniref:Imm1 family immunity protein n=1 Tax=Saccharothrix sp. NRRL B-16314 TaxID=1463825 RepID=UPI0009E0588D|nr:Imm1 family immunity protein [Saccharothrix sp. NRRL B-16314]
MTGLPHCCNAWPPTSPPRTARSRPWSPRPDPWVEGWVAVRLGTAPDRGFIAHADATGSHITTNGGDPDGEPVLYDHQAHTREWPSDAELPPADVIKATHDLVATDGERSTIVNWRTWGL